MTGYSHAPLFRCPHIKRIQVILIAKVESSAGNYWMAPCRKRLLWNAEAPLFLVAVGCGLHQANDSFLAEAVQVTVGKDQ